MSNYIFEIMVGSMALIMFVLVVGLIRTGLAQEKEAAKRKREAEARWAKMTPEERAVESAKRAAANASRSSQQHDNTAALIALGIL